MARSSMIDTGVFGLYIAAIVCSIIELGLTAYATSVLRRAGYYYFYDGAYTNRTHFLLFASIWTLLICAVLLASAFTIARASNGNLAVPITLALHGITWIFWLAGFAAYADVFFGAPRGVPGAILAFAVILWLIFSALLIFNILTAVGVMKSDRVGHGTMRKRTVAHTGPAPATSTVTV